MKDETEDEPKKTTRQIKKRPTRQLVLWVFVIKEGGHLLSRIALQYHRRRRA